MVIIMVDVFDCTPEWFKIMIVHCPRGEFPFIPPMTLHYGTDVEVVADCYMYANIHYGTYYGIGGL